MSTMSNILGSSADYKPHPDDYYIRVQYGKTEPCLISLEFYKSDTYFTILEWVQENNIPYKETTLGKKNTIKCELVVMR